MAGTEFRDYLVAKETLLAKGTDILATGEQDLLAAYPTSSDGSHEIRHGFGSTDGFDSIVVTEREWEAFRDSPKKAATDATNRGSYLYSGLSSGS